MQALPVDDDRAIVRLPEVDVRLAGSQVRSVSGGEDAPAVVAVVRTKPPEPA